MNLQDALTYRTECLIHKQDLRPMCIAPKSCAVEDQIHGIKIAIAEIIRRHGQQIHYLHLNYDGTWQQDSGEDIMSLKSSSIGTIGYIKGTGANLLLLMICPECSDYGASKGSFVGRLLAPVAPILHDIKQQTHNYNILVGATGGNNFECEIHTEVLHHTRDGKFYQVIADPHWGTALFAIGLCEGNTSNQLAHTTMCLNVPHFDFTKIKELDKLIEKMEIYNLFS